MKIKITSLDRKFSLWIRTRDNFTCQNKLYPSPLFKCPTKIYNYITQAAHCYGRAKKSVRFDPENVMALCFHCHKYFDSHTDTVKKPWFEQRIGKDKFALLTLRANTPKKPDYEMINLYLTEKLKEFEIFRG